MNYEELYSQNQGETEIEQIEQEIINMTSSENQAGRYGTNGLWLHQWISELNGKKLFAKEPIVQIDDEELKAYWLENHEENKVKTLLYVAAKKASLDGKVYIRIYEDNSYVGVVYDVAQYGTHESIGGKMVEVETWTTLNRSGFRPIFIREVATDTEIITDGFTHNENGDLEMISNEDLNIKYKLKNLIQRRKHNYGFIPTIVVENTPTFSGNGKPDLLGQDHLIDHLDRIMQRIGFELDVNRTRINIFAEEGDSSDEITKTILANKYNQEFLNTSNLTIIPTASTFAFGDNPSPVEVLAGDPKLQQYFSAYNEFLGLIFEATGFKFNSQDSRQGGVVQKTEFEVNQTKDSETTSFKLKQAEWNNALKELIIKSIKIVRGISLKKSEIGVSIELLNIRNETALIDNVGKMIKDGLLDRPTALAEIKNIPVADAKKIIANYEPSAHFKAVQDSDIDSDFVKGVAGYYNDPEALKETLALIEQKELKEELVNNPSVKKQPTEEVVAEETLTEEKTKEV